jgi:predicted transcriptional regulator
MKHQTPKFCTIKRLSEVTGVPAYLIRYWKRLKKISYVQVDLGGAILIDYNKFLEFLEQNTNAVDE